MPKSDNALEVQELNLLFVLSSAAFHMNEKEWKIVQLFLLIFWHKIDMQLFSNSDLY